MKIGDVDMKCEKMNKTKAVMLHLQKYRKINTWEAIKLYNATRLSAIIFNLRKYGMNIINKQIDFVDVYGNKSYCVDYILIPNKNEITWEEDD